MRFYVFVLLLPLICLLGEARAQLSAGPSSMPEQWQLTLDVIKAKAQSLGVENDGLKDEYQQLVEKADELRQAIDQQRDKNAQSAAILQERHGQTDQDLRIIELNESIRAKNQRLKDYALQLRDLRRRRSESEHKVQAIKYAVRGRELVRLNQKEQIDALPGQRGDDPDPQLGQLRQQLEDESTQEVLLENILAALKKGGTYSAPTLKDLNAHKQELKREIYANVLRLEDLRDSSLMGLSWPLMKKTLVHRMVLIDARNNQMRSQIKGLKEDIDVLRDQIAKLERRADFVQVKDAL